MVVLINLCSLSHLVFSHVQYTGYLLHTGYLTRSLISELEGRLNVEILQEITFKLYLQSCLPVLLLWNENLVSHGLISEGFTFQEIRSMFWGI